MHKNWTLKKHIGIHLKRWLLKWWYPTEGSSYSGYVTTLYFESIHLLSSEVKNQLTNNFGNVSLGLVVSLSH